MTTHFYTHLKETEWEEFHRIGSINKLVIEGKGESGHHIGETKN